MSIFQTLIRFVLPGITCCICLIASESAGQPPLESGQTETVPKRIPPKDRPLEFWVGQLGHDQYYRREVATRRLSEAGAAAVPILQQSIASGDLEATERAIVVLGKIALEQPPHDDSGAWGALNELVESGTGSRRARAQATIAQIWRVRESQALKALATAGVFVGVDHFAIGALTSQVLMVRIGKDWSGDTEALGWLRWLRDIRHASINGEAIRTDVIKSVAGLPNIAIIALVDGKLDIAALEPLKTIKQFDSLEIRYIRLQPDLVDAIAKLPLRESLNLMGTEVKDERIQRLKDQLPGLAISDRKGGFLGVTCDSTVLAECRIRSVYKDSAAYQAGLLADDVIIGIDDAVVNQFADLQAVIKQHLPGDKIKIKFVRRGERGAVEVKLGKYVNH